MFTQMAIKNMPKQGAKASDSTEVEPPKDMSGLAVATIMDAIKASEQSVMAKIENTATALSTDLHTKIERLSNELRREIATVCSELHEVLHSTNQKVKLEATSVQGLEEGANLYSDWVMELEWQVMPLTCQVKN